VIVRGVKQVWTSSFKGETELDDVACCGIVKITKEMTKKQQK